MTISKTTYVKPALVFQMQTFEAQSGQPEDLVTIATVVLPPSEAERGVFRIEGFELSLPDGRELLVWAAFTDLTNGLSAAIVQKVGPKLFQRVSIGGNFLHSGTFGFCLDDGTYIQAFLVDANRQNKLPRSHE